MLHGVFPVILTLFLASQVYWGWKAYRLSGRVFRTRRARRIACAALAGVYLFLLLLNMGWLFRLGARTESALPYAMLSDFLLRAPFLAWVVSSLIAFLFALPVEAIRWVARPFPVSPSRRRLLAAGARAVVGAPFLAGAYGTVYGRLNLEVTRQRVRIAGLPAAFHGFRIAQLSDIHIGPFMPEEQIRKYAEITNSLGVQLVALTGDFLTWERTPERALVSALASLRAPFGVFACLGNHDFWAEASESLTALFKQAGVKTLRHETRPLEEGGERIHLAGIDTVRRWDRPRAPRLDALKVPGEVNLLLSHYPDAFDRAAEAGFDLTLAGHTHGGQVTMEFISPQIAPSRLVTPYVRGLFEKNGRHLYVNRGIGTIGVPMRFGAPPEITVIELVKG